MYDTVASLTTQLTNIDAAIARAESAQSVGSDGTTLSNAALNDLYKRRDVIVQRLDSATSAAAGKSRMFSRGRITGRGDNFG